MPSQPEETPVDELAAILERQPDLARLVERQSDEPDRVEPVVLRRGHSPYCLFRLPVANQPGTLWVSRLPGLRPGHAQVESNALRSFGIDRVVCLVSTRDLEERHGAHNYLRTMRAVFSDRFQQLPIHDHAVPSDDEQFETCVQTVDEALARRERVLVHCVGGCGRSGMFAACVLVRGGADPGDAIRFFRRHRRCGPETPEQVAYVVRYAERLALSRSSATALRAPAIEVVRVTIGQDRPVRLASGGLAAVFVGRARLSDGGIRRVAVKRFHAPLSEQRALDMQDTARELSAAGVRLPKMAMHRLPDGTWVQVSQLFGSSHSGSKLSQPALYFKTLSRSQKVFAVDQLARVATAGYRPSLDLFVVFKSADKGVIPIDLDLVVPEPDTDRGSFELLKAIVQIGADSLERDMLLDAARRASGRVVREALDRGLPRLRRLWAMT